MCLAAQPDPWDLLRQEFLAGQPDQRDLWHPVGR